MQVLRAAVVFFYEPSYPAHIRLAVLYAFLSTVLPVVLNVVPYTV